MNCIYCNQEIEKVSKEHIMQSALGCYKKSIKLLCPDCNNYFARAESGNIDTEFVEQFRFFRNLLNVWGDRKTPPPILYDVGEFEGHPYHIAPGGKPIIAKSLRTSLTTDEGNERLIISSPNIEKAKEQLQHIKRQYGDDIQFEAVLRKSFIKEAFCKSTALGGECASKAVLKDLYNFVFFLKRELNQELDLCIDDLNDLRCFLRYNVETSKCASTLDYVNNIPYKLSDDDLSNYMFLFGSNAQRMIFGFVVVFGNIIFSAVLSNDYQGKDFAYGYKQTPNRSETALISQLPIPNYNQEVVFDFAVHADTHMKGLEPHINNLMRIWSDRAKDDLINSLVQNAVTEMGASESELITKESVGRLTRSLAEGLIQYQYKIPSELPIEINKEDDEK